MDESGSFRYCPSMDRFDQSPMPSSPQATLVRDSGSIEPLSRGRCDPDAEVTSVIAVVCALTRSVRERADVILSKDPAHS